MPPKPSNSPSPPLREPSLHDCGRDVASDLDGRIREALQRGKAARRKEIEREASRFELRLLLMRLGFRGAAIEAAIAAGDADRIPPETRQTLCRAVEACIGTCRRRARSRDPRYDINHHIALQRLWRWLTKQDLADDSWSAGAERPGSGRMCNGRFARRGHRRRRTGDPACGHRLCDKPKPCEA